MQKTKILKLRILQNSIASFYKSESKDSFDIAFQNYILSLNELSIEYISEFPLVLKTHDNNLHSLLSRFQSNFDFSQICQFYFAILNQKGQFYPQCINYFEFLVNRNGFLENLKKSQLTKLLALISKHRNIFTSLNYTIICDQLMVASWKLLKQEDKIFQKENDELFESVKVFRLENCNLRDFWDLNHFKKKERII